MSREDLPEGDRDAMWRKLERSGAVYGRILFRVVRGQALVDAVILYDRYAPPYHREMGDLDSDSDLGRAMWLAAGGRDIEQGDVVSGDGEMGFKVAERAVNTAWNDRPPPLRRQMADGSPIGHTERVFTVLVELPGGAGVLRRDDGPVFVTQDVSADSGQLLGDGDVYMPVKNWLPDDRSLVGGLLPPGAVSAEVVDDRGERVAAGVGGGAYAAILDQPNDGHEPVVCCRDAGGDPVRRPLPANYPSTVVEDAEVPCPACGAIDYEECLPTERWRGGRHTPDGTTIPNPIVVCRRCGQQEREGTFFGPMACSGDEADEAAPDARVASARAQRWYATTMTLRSVTFPIYAAEGWPAAIGGSGSRGDRLVSLTIDHYDSSDADPYAGDLSRIEITTSNDDRPLTDELRQARSTLHAWLQNRDGDTAWPHASDAAITLWLAARDRESRAKVLAAARSEQLIGIDGTPQTFLTLTAPTGHWAAVRRHEDLMITIAAHDLDPTTITIDPIPDPAARLLGPKPPDPEAS
jgi:hypothetical protein